MPRKFECAHGNIAGTATSVDQGVVERFLAGADLRNARLSGAYFRVAWLADAIWEDGRVCGSTGDGECEY